MTTMSALSPAIHERRSGIRDEECYEALYRTSAKTGRHYWLLYFPRRIYSLHEQRKSIYRANETAEGKVRERYITDNPFRLVGAGAAITQQQLRRKSEAISRSATVGLNTSPPLETEFGSEDIGNLVASVRSLATNAVQRTAYRVLWPLSEHTVPYILNGQSPEENAIAPEEFAQLTFLTAWYGFLRDKTSHRAAEALNSWIDLYNDTAMDSRLKALIMEDDNLDEDDAYERLLEAQEQIARHLLRRTASVATQEWEAGNTTSATGIVEALLNSALDGSMQEEALDPVIEIGQGLADKVKQLTSDLPPYTRGASTDPPRELVQLERLSSALANRHPMAGGWGDIVEHWYLVLGWKMRGAALDMYEQDDDEGARAIVEEALRLVRDAQLKERLLEDRTSLEQVLADKERYKPYAEIEKISSAPILSTINGIGTTLYGSAPFPLDQHLRYSTLYFVFFYIPVFPMVRYVVESTGPNQWKFYGKVKWTAWMKAHLVVTCTLILFGTIAITHSSDTSAPSGDNFNKLPKVNREPYHSSDTSAPSGDNGKTEDNRRMLLEPHRQYLEQQLKDWKTAIQTVKEEIALDGKDIDEERAALESLKAKINGMNPDTRVQQEVDDYNALVQSYESQRRDFNAHVQRHNSKIEDFRETVRRHNAIVDDLNKDR
jgi:hypothetical protein